MKLRSEISIKCSIRINNSHDRKYVKKQNVDTKENKPINIDRKLINQTLKNVNLTNPSQIQRV